ncbi:MAG: MFS transporter [Clostridia bacterium]|nr:MFS transporter [Clostridia bacterium]
MQKEDASKRLFLCLFIVYIINVFGKIAFSAVTVELVSDGILTKTQAGLVGAMFWLIYAIGQIFGGVVANKLSPYFMLGFTYIGSVVTNMLMFFSRGFVPMLIIWSVNGFVQFGMWPAILKLLTTEIIPSQRGKATSRISYCYCIGSILSYFLTSLILLVFDWKYMFAFCAVANLVSFIYVELVRRKCSPCLEEEATERVSEQKAKPKLTLRLVLESGLILFCIMMFIRSLHESSVKTWMPTILTETYNASSSFTLMLSVVLLAVNLFGVTVAFFIHRKARRNEAGTVSILYAITIPLMLLLTGFRGYNIIFTTVIMTVMTLLFYGAGQVIIMLFSSRFQNLGLTATVGGIINSFAAFGNVAASYGGGFVADNFGWDALIWVWFALGAIFVTLSVSTIFIYRKFKRRTAMMQQQ